jgi:hypothetical protein
MSKHETPITRWYWRQVGGTLIEEFCAVERSKTCESRRIDAVIVKNGPTRRKHQRDVVITGKDIIVVQTKPDRLGMNLMGQAFFSAQLMKRFKPRSIESVALVAQDDSVLRRLFERFKGMRVVVYSPRRALRR